MKMRTLGRFVCLVLLVAAAGTVAVSSAQERMMGGAGITVFNDQNFRGRSSTFRQDVYDPPSQGDYLVLFDRTNYRGTPTNYNGPTPDLYSLSGRAQSVTIGRGAWELCTGRNYTGRCVVIDRSVPNFAVYNLRNRVSSRRPLRRQPRLD